MDVIPRTDSNIASTAKTTDPTGRGRRLRVIEKGNLSMALDVAVLRALRSEMKSYDELGVQAIQRIVRREFGKLVRDNAKKVRGIPEREFVRDLDRSRDEIVAARDRTRAEHGELQERAALLRDRQLADAEHERVEVVERSQRFEVQLADRVRSILRSAKRESYSPRKLNEALVAASSELARSEWERSFRERENRAEQEIAQSERRIKKLTQSLRATEAALADLAKLKDGNAGLASVYRTVQGLEGGPDSLTAKRAMLESIFESNLSLQKALQ